MRLKEAIKFGQGNNKLNADINDFLINEGIDPFKDEDTYKFMFNLLSAISERRMKKHILSLIKKWAERKK